MKQKPKTLLRAWDAAQTQEPGITPRVFALRQGFSDNGKHTAEDVLMVRLETARREQEIAGKYHFSLGQPLALQGDYMLVGDPHAPFIDYQWAERVAAVATKRLKAPRRLIVGGDFVNGDKWSSYPHIIEPPTWANERDALRGLVDYWLSTFAEITFLMGNHDRRLQKFTGGAFDDTDIIGMINSNRERVNSSNFGWCTIESGGEVYRVTHPKNYSVNQLVVASDLALKYNQHIISFHEHHLSLGWDRYKRHVIVNGGCLADFSKFAYVNLDDSKAAGMANGFVMVKVGAPYLFGPAPMTDWSEYE